MTEPTLPGRFEEQTARLAAQGGPSSENARALAAAFVGSYFCSARQRFIHPNMILDSDTDGILCKGQGREHIVYVRGSA